MWNWARKNSQREATVDGTFVRVPTVDDWWELTKRFPKFRRFTLTPLKDQGYMELFSILESQSTSRILEFGHGLNIAEDANLFLQFRDKELWGVDADQGLAYFESGNEWEARYQKEVVQRYPWVKFVNGLLGEGSSIANLPIEYFDAVCSVSVLEEIPLEGIPPILDHAYRLLARNGLFVNSHDIRLKDTQRFEAIIELHRQAGFHIDQTRIVDPSVIFDATHLLLENPIGVMLYYQGAQGEDRKFMGNFATMIICARKTA